MIMANDEAFIKKCRMYRDWGRIGDNSEAMANRFTSSVDGIPYDGAISARISARSRRSSRRDLVVHPIASSTSVSLGKFLYGVVGYNAKSTEMNAAFGLAQALKYVFRIFHDALNYAS